VEGRGGGGYGVSEEGDVEKMAKGVPWGVCITPHSTKQSCQALHPGRTRSYAKSFASIARTSLVDRASKREEESGDKFAW
jgi:hypothetical protein